MWRHHCRLRAPELHSDEADDENSEDDEESDDAAIPPWVFGAAPLQSEEEGDDGWHEEQVPVEIEALEAFLPSNADDGRSFRIMEQKHYSEDSDRAKGEVDVKAEAPCYFILIFI